VQVTDAPYPTSLELDTTILRERGKLRGSQVLKRFVAH
jgi:hypothetical protein